MRDVVEGTRVRQVIRRRCECCGVAFTAKRAARRQFFCSSRCRDADRRDRNFRHFGAARRGRSAVPRSSQKTHVISRPCEGTFGDRASPLIGPQDLPVNILGGYRFLNTPEIDLETETGLGPDDPRVRALIATIPADLSIPDFLRPPLPSKSGPAQEAG